MRPFAAIGVPPQQSESRAISVRGTEHVLAGTQLGQLDEADETARPLAAQPSGEVFGTPHKRIPMTTFKGRFRCTDTGRMQVLDSDVNRFISTLHGEEEEELTEDDEIAQVLTGGAEGSAAIMRRLHPEAPEGEIEPLPFRRRDAVDRPSVMERQHAGDLTVDEKMSRFQRASRDRHSYKSVPTADELSELTPIQRFVARSLARWGGR